MRFHSIISKSPSSTMGLAPEAQSYGLSLLKDIWTSERNVSVGTLYDVIKKSPEVVGCLRVLVHDIMSEGFVFLEGKNGTKGSVKKAYALADKTGFYKILADALFDLLITGDAYILKLKVGDTKISSFIDERISNFNIKGFNPSILKQAVLNEIDLTDAQTNGFQVLKSSTIEGMFNESGVVEKWIQTVGTIQKEFSPDEIIHLTITNIGGSVYGFTPLHTLLADIGTLIYAKDNASKIFENQGVPPSMFNLPDAQSEEDRQFQVLRQQLQELKDIKNKYRSIITFGNVQHQKIDTGLGDGTWFKDLIMHFTNVIMFAWNIPVNRVPFVNANIKGEASKEVTEGYYKGIAFTQKILESQLNPFWSAFKVQFVFNKSYKIDELREANISAIMWDRNAMTIEEGRVAMGLPEKIPEGTMPVNMKQGLFTRYNENNEQRATQEQQPEGNDETDNKLKWE